MVRHELLNLSVGGNRPGGRFSEWRVGPFVVTFVGDYEETVKRLPKIASRTDGWEFDEKTGNMRKTTVFNEGRVGEWIATSVATLSDEDAASTASLLADDPIEDGGLWDLCNILTFLTGQRVASGDQSDRWPLRDSGNHVCNPSMVLFAAPQMWGRRDRLRELGMEYALLMHNEANGLSMLQASGALYTMAVNVLLDRYPVEVAPEATGTDGGEDHRDIVCPVVGQAIAEATGLSPELKAGWQAKLLSVARQGLSGSMKGRLESLLASLRLLASEELQKPEVKRRIKCVNKVRNVLMHAGRLPGTLPGAKSREVAERYGVAIALGVFPDLVQVGLWKAMGLPSEGGPSLLQQTDNLRAFFLQGRARGWPLEDVAFEEWFESDAGYEQ